MFHIVRLVVLCLIAFVAGILFERQAQAERCTAKGGTMTGPICTGAAQ